MERGLLARHGPSDCVLEVERAMASLSPARASWLSGLPQVPGCPIDWPVKGHLVGWLPRDSPGGQGWD